MKSKKDMSDKDTMSIQFVMACRHYNRAFSCQRYITKIIQEYVSKISISNFVKKIPDECDPNGHLGIKSKAAIFAQKACLALINRVSKKHLFKKFCQNYPNLKSSLEKAYHEMMNSFDESQELLKNQRFAIIYDQNSFEIIESGSAQSNQTGQKLQRISYFQDFILMQ